MDIASSGSEGTIWQHNTNSAEIDVMVGSPSTKIAANMEYLWISWELLVQVASMVCTYPTWTIIIPTLWIQSENVDIKMQVCDWQANKHTALKRLGCDFTDRKKGWRCSLDRISKVYRYRHQKTKLKIKFHLFIGDSCHQNIKKYVTWGLKLQKFYVFFPCNPMEPFISGVRPCNTQKSSNCHCLNDFLSRNEHGIFSNSWNLPLDM